MKGPDLRLPDRLCHYVINVDEVRDIRTGRSVDARRDDYQYATDWFAMKVKEVQDFLNGSEEARRHAMPASLIVAQEVFRQLIAEGKPNATETRLVAKDDFIEHSRDGPRRPSAKSSGGGSGAHGAPAEAGQTRDHRQGRRSPT